MIWVLFALGTALCYGLQGAWSKRLTARVSELAGAWALFAFSFPLLLVTLAITGMPRVEPVFWPALGANTVLSLLSFYLYVSALHHGELGLTVPLLALTPVFLVPVEWLLLGDTPDLHGMGGIVLVVAGVYLLHLPVADSGGAGPLEPLRAIARDRGSRRMLAVAVLWSVSGVVDKVAVTHASTAFYGAALTGALAVGFLPLLSRLGGGLRAAFAPGGRRALVVQGLLFGTMFILQMEALQRTLAAYVITIKRSGALVTVVLGALFFGERELAKRLVGTAVIVAGVLLVVTA